MENNTTLNSKNNLSSNSSTTKKTIISSFRGFVSIDQEMGREIAMMFFKPSKKISFSESGHLAGKI